MTDLGVMLILFAAAFFVVAAASGLSISRQVEKPSYWELRVEIVTAVFSVILAGAGLIALGHHGPQDCYYTVGPHPASSTYLGPAAHAPTGAHVFCNPAGD